MTTHTHQHHGKTKQLDLSLRATTLVWTAWAAIVALALVLMATG